DHDGRNRLRRLLRRRHGGRGPRQDEIHVRPHELCGEGGKLRSRSLRPPLLDGDVLTVNVAMLVQRLTEDRQERCARRGWGHREGTDTVDPSCIILLSPGGERRREQAQDEHHDAPDSATPHRHLLELALYRPSSFHGSRTTVSPELFLP